MGLLASNLISDGISLLVSSGPAQLVPPAWVNALLIAGVCAGLGAAIAGAIVDERRVERRIYWSGWLITTGCFSLAALYRGWQPSLGFGLLCVFVAVFYAYMRTPFLKIGGRIYALSITNSQPDAPAGEAAELPSAVPHDSYPTPSGPVSARNLWWVLVALTCLMASGVYFGGWPWQLVFGTTALAIGYALAGVDDATRKLPIARGQYVQAGIASLVSIPLWLAPCICYLLGYGIGQRWPMGRGKHATPPPNTED